MALYGCDLLSFISFISSENPVLNIASSYITCLISGVSRLSSGGPFILGGCGGGAEKSLAYKYNSS